jgi:hypothetical protein
MRKRVRLLAVIAMGVLGFAAWGGLQVFAASAPTKADLNAPIPAGKIGSLQPALPSSSTQLIRTYNNSNEYGNFISGGFTAIDPPTTIQCKPPNTYKGTCVLEVTQSVQLGDSGVSGNHVAICTEIDGSYFLNCPYLGDTLANNHFQGYSFTQNIAGLSQGSHTVQDVVYADNPVYAAYYSFEYRLYSTG